MGSTIASKIKAVGLDNTSLIQCGASHVAALGTGNHTGQVTTHDTTFAFVPQTSNCVSKPLGTGVHVNIP